MLLRRAFTVLTRFLSRQDCEAGVVVPAQGVVVRLSSEHSNHMMEVTFSFSGPHIPLRYL